MVQGIIKVHFDINRDQIKKELCEQKANVNSSCNGQCVLIKRLNVQKQNEVPKNLELKDNRTHTEYFQLSDADEFVSFTATKKWMISLLEETLSMFLKVEEVPPK